MTAFGTCAGTVRHSVCVCNSSRACVCATDTCAFALAIGRSPICAAGVTWTSRTPSAQWAGRAYHSTVVDAAGAIYVIGGWNGTNYNDVWVSNDGGADRTRGAGVLEGYVRVLEGYLWVLEGLLMGYSMVLTGYSGVAARVPRDYLRGTPMVLPGDCTHARGRNSRGALAHSVGYSVGYHCRGGLGGNIILRGTRWALQRTPGGTRRSDGGLRGLWVLKGYGRALRRYSRRSLGVLEGFVLILIGSQRVLKRHFYWYSQGIPQKSGVLKGCTQGDT
jgi:hypothetical protein